MEMDHKTFYLLGEDVVFLLSMVVGAGEVGIFAKLGKLSKLEKSFASIYNKGKVVLNATQRGLAAIRESLRSVVRFAYRTGTQTYDLIAIATNRVIATYKNGVIKVKVWVDISGNKGRFLSENIDGSQTGLRVAKTDQGKVGICDNRGLCFDPNTLIFK